jgi:hypothetical protein
MASSSNPAMVGMNMTMGRHAAMLMMKVQLFLYLALIIFLSVTMLPVASSMNGK